MIEFDVYGWASVLCIDGGGDHAANKVTESMRGTGWCLLKVHAQYAPVLVAHGQVRGGPAAWLEAIITAKKVAINLDEEWNNLRRALQVATHMVVEDFKLIRPVPPGVNIDPLEIVGMMEMWCALRGTPLTRQMPSERLAVTHDDLKLIDMWPGGTGHADTAQAIRHGLVALMKQRHQPTMRLISPPD